MKHSGPLHPQHATLEARLRTFREWPPALRQQPAELADAGFYYIGCSDQVGVDETFIFNSFLLCPNILLNGRSDYASQHGTMVVIVANPSLRLFLFR